MMHPLSLADLLQSCKRHTPLIFKCIMLIVIIAVDQSLVSSSMIFDVVDSEQYVFLVHNCFYGTIRVKQLFSQSAHSF